MAVVANDEMMSDEEWLVTRARGYTKSDPFAAKAWMITARTLFPQNFIIQFEAYMLEKSGKNVTEAARLLSEMFQVFPNEAKLWGEVQCMLEAMQSDASDQKTQLHTDIFAAMPTTVQCHMLLCVAEKISDILEQCRLLLLAMRKFPNLITEQGLKLIETLISAEKHNPLHCPVNCYRKLLVCDVLPLVLQKSRMLLPPADLYRWLQKAIEFSIIYVTQPPCQESTPPASAELMSPTKKSLTKKYATIPGLQDKESQVTDPWGGLFKLMSQIGTQLSWDIDRDFFSKPRDYQWQQIVSLYNRARQTAMDTCYKKVLYVTTVIFLDCLYTYISCVDTEIFATVAAGSLIQAPLVLIEGFKTDNVDNFQEMKIKKLRSETASLPQIHATSVVPNAQAIIQNFVTALHCYELLHSYENLHRDFIKLCKNWRMETWSWMSHFQTDMFIYQGTFQEAVGLLQNFSMGVRGKMHLRNTLQLASCFYCLGSHPRACELVLDVIGSIKENAIVEQIDKKSKSLLTLGSGRQLLLTVCTETEILSYCIQLLIFCFKERVFSSHGDDMILGHMIVLLQYDWPKHQTLFAKAIQKIQNQGAFTYNIFFTYVINIDILEEFAFIKTQEGGKVNLDILPMSTKILAQQRTVTRGVNKGVKEDFRATMEKQVRRSDELVDKVVLQFLTEERNLFL